MSTRTTNLFDELPPSDVSTERGLLAALLVDPTQMDSVALQITARDFHDPVNGRLYDALATLHDARELRTDIRLLIPQLRALHISEASWSIADIVRLIGEGMASNAPLYAAELRRLSQLRQHQDVACQLFSRVHAPGAEPEAITRWIESAIEQCGRDDEPHSRLIGDVANDVLAAIKDGSQEQRGIMSGLPSVDSSTGGMMAGELTIIAARPGCGKTSLATQIALHTSRKQRNVLFVSLEMTKEELTQRVMCSIAGVDGRRLRNGSLERKEREALIDAAVKLQGLPFTICDPSAVTINDVRSIARWHHKTSELSLLVLDYIGLVKPTDHRRQRYEQVGEVTVGAKSLAKELGIPIIACCQLNREADKQAPTLGMLRESGNIEQDADMVWFVHHEDKSGPVSLIVAKHRHGETGQIPLWWIPEETTFQDVDNRDPTLTEWNNQ